MSDRRRATFDPAFAGEAERIADDRRQWFTDLKAANARGVTRVDLDALMRRSEATNAEIEQLRRRFFPRVNKLIITSEGACTASPTGRSTRTVWSRSRPTMWADEPADD